MSDPKRLLSDPSTAKHLSALLRQLPVPAPPSPAKEAELTRALMAPPAAIPTGFAGTAWVAGGAALALIIGGAWLALRSEAPPTPTGSRSIVSPPAPLSAVAPPPLRGAEAQPPAAPPPPPARSALRRQAPVDTLAAEAQLLEEARKNLVSSPATALTFLRQHQARFPSGQLGAERLFLTVQALERSGDAAAASRQAEVLLQKFPRSVYATQLREKATSREKD